MTIEDILSLEQGNRSKIYLHLEGTFWRAYEQSAYVACMIWKNHKKLCKYVKYLGRDVVMIGFPDTALEARLKGLKGAKGSFIDKKTVCIETNILIGDGDFEKWRKADTQKVQLDKYVHTYYDTVPVYKAVHDLILSFMALNKHMRGDIRDSYGYALHMASLNVLKAIMAANKANADKVTCLDMALDAFTDVDMICKLLYEADVWSQKQYSHIIIVMGDIAVQLNAWKKSYCKKEEKVEKAEESETEDEAEIEAEDEVKEE